MSASEGAVTPVATARASAPANVTNSTKTSEHDERKQHIESPLYLVYFNLRICYMLSDCECSYCQRTCTYKELRKKRSARGKRVHTMYMHVHV
jgi:hypothetical protein